MGGDGKVIFKRHCMCYALLVILPTKQAGGVTDENDFTADAFVGVLSQGEPAHAGDPAGGCGRRGAVAVADEAGPAAVQRRRRGQR